MAILDIQRRGQQIGRLRLGEKVATGKTDKNGNEIMRPVRRATWRITTGSRYEAEAIAARFGGEVRDWEGEYEVATDTAEIPVTVPPRDEVISQWYEMWNKGGCLRRCNSQVQESGAVCACPHAGDPADADEVTRKALERAGLAKLNPPQACKLVTRINLMIPDLPGLGVFRLDTGSYYAAVEIGDTAQLMQLARDKGVFLPALLRIEQRQRVAGGQTKKYPVPVLEILATFRDLATGAIEQAGIMAQLPPAPGERLAITAAPVPSPRPGVLAGQDSPPLTAQQIASAVAASGSREEVERWMAVAKENRVEDDHVRVPDLDTELYEPLAGYAAGKWKSLGAAG